MSRNDNRDMNEQGRFRTQGLDASELILVTSQPAQRPVLNIRIVFVLFFLVCTEWRDVNILKWVIGQTQGLFEKPALRPSADHPGVR